MSVNENILLVLALVNINNPDKIVLGGGVLFYSNFVINDWINMNNGIHFFIQNVNDTCA